jgi:hypothetical protein
VTVKAGDRAPHDDRTAVAAPAAPTVFTAAVITWLVTAAWDFVCASLLGVLAYGSTFARFWQGVASVPLGARAFAMGARGVAAGLALHLFVAFVWSTVFVLLLSRAAALRRIAAGAGGALCLAVVYGPSIWLVMSLVVIPAATGRPPAFGFRWWVQVAAHVPFVTLPLVFTARRMLGLATHA